MTIEVSRMAGCHTHRKQLSAFLDGELPLKKRAALEEHLAACAACRRELAALEGLGPVMGRLEVPAPPAGLAARITAEVRRARSEKGLGHLVRRRPAGIPVRLWGLKALGAAAVLVLMLSLGQFVGTRGWLPGSSGDRTAVSGTAGKEAEGLEWFAPGPPGSLVSGYLAMAGRRRPAGGPHP